VSSCSPDQPIVSVADGRWAAVEALARWAHPTRGVLAPDPFLDVAEQTGAIVGIVVEITESTVLDSPAVHATLDELVRLRLGLALDDFGPVTPRSPRSAACRSTPSRSKSFVARSASEPADQVVVEAIVQMAGRLGLHVAEGVETPAQQRYLEGAGIDAVQGYLHLPPVPAGEFAAWLFGSPASRSTAARATVG
jgi:EAL domain-containing protein (putative c-di-GMP-specific phosphodiesterase class I)